MHYPTIPSSKPTCASQTARGVSGCDPSTFETLIAYQRFISLCVNISIRYEERLTPSTKETIGLSKKRLGFNFNLFATETRIEEKKDNHGCCEWQVLPGLPAP